MTEIEKTINSNKKCSAWIPTDTESGCRSGHDIIWHSTYKKKYIIYGCRKCDNLFLKIKKRKTTLKDYLNLIDKLEGR